MQKLWWHRSVRGRTCDAINKSWRRAFWRYPSRQLRWQLQAITKQNTGERKGRRQNLLSGTYRTKQSLDTIALCNKSSGRCDIKAEKREELESKSSHKSDIWLPAASKKWGEIYWKYIFQTLEAIFPYKGVFVTKVVKANIIAFIKTKILRPVTSMTTPPPSRFLSFTPP